jgi:hypothetical protein
VDYQVQSPAGAWSGWMGLGGGVQSISAICDNGGNLAVFAVGTDQAVDYRETAYNAVSGALFGSNGPSYLDVQQGGLGDCWLLAGLAEVADRDPQDIKNMFTYDGTTVDHGAIVGLYQVRFYNSIGAAEYVYVDTELPAGGGLYDHPINGILWVALAEKAYAEANAAGIVTSNHKGIDDYDALNGGDGAVALQAITGNPASDYSINPTNIAAAWNAGKLVVLGTTTPVSSYIASDHVYALVGYNASASQPFTVFNPWGTDSSGWAPGYSGTVYGLFTANAAFISQNFATYGVGTEAALGEDHTRPDIIVPTPTDHELAKPENVAVVRINSSRSDATVVRSFRPAVVAATGSEGLGVIDAVTPGASSSSRRLWAKRFGSTMR